MFSADGVKGFARRAFTSPRNVGQALADALFPISARGDVEQPLIGCRVPDHCGYLPFHAQHYRSLALLALL